MYTIYEIFFPLFSLYLYPRDMHLEEISHLSEYHCNHSVYLRQWISISYRFYFQQWHAEATCSCTVQSAEFLALWLSLLVRWVELKRLFFFSLTARVRKEIVYHIKCYMNDICPLKFLITKQDVTCANKMKNIRIVTQQSLPD